MGLLLEIFWIALIVLCVGATIYVAVRDNARRKKLYAERMSSMDGNSQDAQMSGAVDNLDDFGGMPNEPDFDFSK